MELDPGLPEAWAQLANVLSWSGWHDAGLAEFERAMALNPSFADWRFATALTMAGDAARAIEVSRAYMRADPFAPVTASAWLGGAYYLLRDYARARTLLVDCVARMPNARFAHAFLAATHAQLGDLDRARAEVAEVLRIEPRFTLEGMSKVVLAFRSSADAEHYREGLLKAGCRIGRECWARDFSLAQRPRNVDAANADCTLKFDHERAEGSSLHTSIPSCSLVWSGREVDNIREAVRRCRCN